MKPSAARTETISPNGSQDLQEQVKLLCAQVEEMRSILQRNGAARFNADDNAFLIWVLGFTAGAHLERDGERGERIFARCRDLWIKAQEPIGGNAS